MPGSLAKYAIDWRKLRSPEMKSVLLEVPAMAFYTDYPAAAVAVHAAIASDNAAAVTTNITSPANPRSVDVVFAALWDGGDITIVGTDQFGRAQTEVIADNAGNTVKGVKVWKTITSINNETVGAGGAKTATVQTGDKLALPLPLKYAWGIELVAGVAELATWDATYHAFTPTTVADGAKDFTVLFPVDWAATELLKLYT